MFSIVGTVPDQMFHCSDTVLEEDEIVLIIALPQVPL